MLQTGRLFLRPTLVYPPGHNLVVFRLSEIRCKVSIRAFDTDIHKLTSVVATPEAQTTVESAWDGTMYQESSVVRAILLGSRHTSNFTPFALVDDQLSHRCHDSTVD